MIDQPITPKPNRPANTPTVSTYHTPPGIPPAGCIANIGGVLRTPGLAYLANNRVAETKSPDFSLHHGHM